MTEEEARKKWCPMVRLDLNYISDTACNRHGGDTNCIASDCMMWKWSNKNMGYDSDGNRVPVYGDCGLKG